MPLIGNFFHVVISQPLENLLALTYLALPIKDLGLAIVLFTVILRLILFPLTVKAMRAQRALAKLQPKVKEVQERFKKDREAQGREIMALYREHRVNPFASLLPILIQLPVLFALWRILLGDVREGSFGDLYSFLPDPGTLSLTSFGLVNLAESFPALAIAAGAAQFLQSKLAMKDMGTQQGDFAKMFARQSLFVFPLITVVIAWQFPAALTLYWFVTTIVAAGQHWLAQRFFILHEQPLSPKNKRGA